MRVFKLIPGPILKAAHLSRDGLRRLEWIDWYNAHGKNASLTCRHFGISCDIFYRWINRYNKRKLTTLEFDTKTRTPHRVREMTNPLADSSALHRTLSAGHVPISLFPFRP